MAITINFAGASLSKPGSYSNLTVAQAGVATPAVGTVALIGEADGGLPFDEESGLSAVSFGPDELNAIKEKFGSGPLVDAAALAIAPSNDPQIRGGAQELIMLKTNKSTKASAVLEQGAGTVYGTVKHKKSGAAGNKIYVHCTAPQASTRTLTLSIPGKDPLVATIGGSAMLKVKLKDGMTAASLTITATHLQISASSGGAPSLSIPLAEATTVAELVKKINAQGVVGTTAYYEAAAADSTMANKPSSRLDQVSSQPLSTSFLSVTQDAAQVKDFFALAGDDIEFIQALKKGLPDAQSAAKYLAGGTKGATSNADILKCFDALLKRRVNFIVPLFSRDASADIEEELTDAYSNYTIESVHMMAASHTNEASTVKGRKERQAWVGFKGTFDESVERAAALNSYRVAMCIQDIKAVGGEGSSKEMQPHMLAVISAGMHASAAIGLSTTFKSVSVSDLMHDDFHYELHAEKAIAANLTFAEKSPNGGFRFVLDNNTYASETSAWIYNRPSVIYAGDFASYAIRLSTEQFVGQRNSDVSAETVKNLLVGVFDGLRALGVIVPDNNTAGRGYKDLSIAINGSVINISVTLTLVENFEFILSDLKVQRAG